ncbi:nucleoside 2-deoxyribosyltransferase domain-containing protein [Lacinutrix mariniflava]|uniref:nucleoside 2-deoxyribosyltransferase domain-containing protein n=1 Tax=Lacinutrix mariniflava TaxID=342955 RepID=UPI0006E39045|nr:nucleoside 2-deoxyribosyltransferase domain-containing protein [Lacinutrix mariniflava]
MIYTSKNILPLKEERKKYYFLAGSMDFNESNSWRQKIMQEMKHLVHFLDATRIEHNDFSDSQMKEHIEWELDALIISDKIILNFKEDSKSPISILELGMYVKSSKLVVVCPNKFYQRRYINVLCNKYNTPFFDSFDEAIEYLKKEF